MAMLVEGCEDNAVLVVSTPYALEVRRNAWPSWACLMTGRG